MIPLVFNRFGKYRFLVVSIGLFLIFDLGVLGLNFYTSGKIAEQTERINLAGRQRTLTQQMSKATLYIKSQKLQQWVYQSGLSELRDYYFTFGKTLDAFDKGGTTTSAETGQFVHIKPVLAGKGREILNDALTLWRGFEGAMAPLMVDSLITDEEIIPASEFIALNNLEMFAYMNQLTEHFTEESEHQTSFLRMVQVIGILLATINFFIIMFHFIKQLKSRDDKLEVKQNESNQILETIAEGVFLIDKDMKIGGQHSSFLRELFKTNRISGRELSQFLKPYFSQKTIKIAMGYVQLYFKEHINAQLISDINPLKRIKALVPTDHDQVEEKYLDFSFALIEKDNDEQMLLVTVNDVTDSIMLELEESKKESDTEQQMMMFSQLSKVSAASLEEFITELEHGYELLNKLLKDNKNVQDNYKRSLISLFRQTHKLKGDASVNNLDWVIDQLHDFETGIDEIQQQAKTQELKGHDLLPLTIKLKTMYDSLDAIKFFSKKLQSYGVERNVALAPVADNVPKENKKWFELDKLATELGGQQGIPVDVNLRGFNEVIDRRLNDALYPIALQLVRNSIAHGFESHSTRGRLKKPNAGQISISFSHDNSGNYRFVYEDDGRGFDYESIRQTLITENSLSANEAAKLTKTDLIKRSFTDRFTTSKSVNELSGRGVGLALVWNQIQILKGSLKVRSTEKEFTQFVIDFENQFEATIVKLAS